MYILYGGDFTRSGLVQWVLDEGGLDYEFRKVDIINGEHKTPGYLAINPAGLVPAMIMPDGEVLTETAALMGISPIGMGSPISRRRRLIRYAPAFSRRSSSSRPTFRPR